MQRVIATQEKLSAAQMGPQIETPQKSQKSDYQQSISEAAENEISPVGIKSKLQSSFEFIGDNFCAVPAR
jgi:hypothetical protein